MRTPIAALTALVLLTTTLVTATASASVSAASGSLTVTTYDRTGKAVAAALTMVNVATNTQYTATGNKAKALPNGTYAVVTDIWTTVDQTDTLGARVLRVAGKTKTTIDARAGRLLRINLDKDPGPAYLQQVRAQICAVPGSVTEIGAWNSPGKLFAIPDPSKLLQFAFASTWQADNESYVVAGSTKTTVPTGLSYTFRQASLATVTSVLRSGTSAGENDQLQLIENAACKAGYGSTAYYGPMPATVVAHVSAGRWQAESQWTATQKDGTNGYIGTLPYALNAAAGKSYRLSYLNAPWGPARNLPVITSRGIEFDTSSMFTDPNAGTWGGEGSERSKVTLFDAKQKVLRSVWQTDWADGNAQFTGKIAKKGWYTLEVNGQRYRPDQTYPPTLLSNQASAVFHLVADPKAAPRTADVIVPRLAVLSGLNLSNTATHDSSVVVEIRPDRSDSSGPDFAFGSVTAKTVTLSASFDGGKTWHAAPVRKVGTKWQATVTNATSGDYVALRSRLTATNSQWVEITDYRAYRLG